MFTNASLDSGNLKDLAQLQKAALRQMKLSGRQLSVLDRYCHLANLTETSEADINELAATWKRAENDEVLTRALALLDETQVESLKGSELLADDGNLRAFLSEYVSVTAEAKLKRMHDDREEIDPEKPHLMMLCPDGSGFVRKAIPKEGYLDLSEVCESCSASFHNHQSYIVIGGGIPVTK
jgi:hypothetical protein